MLRTTSSLFLILVITSLFSQNFDSACVQQRHVLRMLQVLHYSPPDFTGETNREILDLFIRQADEKNVFFSDRDANALHLLASQVSSPDLFCAAIRLSYVNYSYKLRVLDSLLQQIESQPMALDGRDTINFVFRRRERVYYEDNSELHKRLEKRLKYDVLRSLGRSFAVNGRYVPDSATVARIKSRCLRKLRRNFGKLAEPAMLLSHLSDCMSDAIARRCDPHSNYLNSAGFGNYRNALSTLEKSYGFSVAENSAGDLEIAALVPGGPAWKSEHLEEKDLVLAIRPGNGELIPAFELGADDLNSMLEETTHDAIGITVLGRDKQQRTVELQRELIHSAQNLVSGFVVTLNGRKMGLISIPSFYIDEQPGGQKGCANDVAAEIIRLRQDSVEGLIIDLRYNGGGSMREAIELAGLFIDEGPVAIYHARNESPFLLKDPNRGTVWHGPLLVLINAASASASEFVAAALQDYGRAIVAGTESYGKGTAQNLLPADTNAVASVYESDPDAVMKITGGKFYRLSGHSLQGRGIQPDISIPGVLGNVIEREAQLPFFLPCDSVAEKAFYSPAPLRSRPEILERSRNRLSTERFIAIAMLGDSLKLVSRNTERVALGLADYLAYSQRQKDLNRKLERLFTVTDPEVNVTGTTAGNALIKIDPYLRTRHERSVAALTSDIVFLESAHIMADMIELDTHE